MSNFTTIAPNYQQTAMLQKSASERLFDMLDIRRNDDVLDLGCGPGNLAQKIRSATDGIVVGIDPSGGMIAEAQRNSAPDITFYVGDAESLNMADQFDAIFCNSAFHWFRDPWRAVVNCYNALRSSGRIAIQAPARTNYCPNFLLATDSLKGDPRTQEPFTHFRSPWFFLETAEGYGDIFTGAGFSILSSVIETVTQRCGPEKTFEMFESGAAAGYLNPDCYETALPSDYISTARDLLARHFHSQAASDGQVELTVFRIYLLACKP
jgi:trans-aconitate 2-methyltransferase